MLEKKAERGIAVARKKLPSRSFETLFRNKQGKDLEPWKGQALKQILDNRYYTGLSGEIICVGMAHDGKRCRLVYETIIP